ncbi:MAG TPA: AsmA-like C-terminal region-containing protein, partial [Burkholderiaceae bacterium]|nr:AsmA-like C-terminal region-containing protein [Burkholderiaceae bacterium]
INLPELDLDAWRDFSATLAETPGDSAIENGYVPTRIQLRAAAVRMFDRRIDDVTVQATRDRDWRMQINSRQIEGTAVWTDATPQAPDGKLTLRLKRLLIPQVPEENVVTEAFARRAESLPSLDLVSNTLDIGGKALGKLTIVARSEKQESHPVWTLERLALEQPAATFEARGSWRIPRRLRSEPDPERRTILSFTLTMRDAGALLDRLGMQRMLRGGDGTLEGRLAWQGSPMAIDYPSLTGRLMLDVKDGVLLNVEPGAARLLGILSLQGLARLVTLDFRGVASSGTVFDATTASAEVRNGIATTNDFRMRSPQFTMEMKGSTNIPAETQQLEVTVLPKINATTASLATTFINPAIGLGTLAAQLLFADQVSNAFRQQYRISGSWSAPDIRKVGDNSGTSNTADTSQPNHSN